MKPVLMIFSALVFFTTPAFAEKASVACTMEAKACPDGSYVSRGGPHCEFAPCPGADGKSGDSGGGTGTVSPGQTGGTAPGEPPQDTPQDTASPPARR